MRKIVTAMKVSVDAKTEGPKGYADWVDAWSEDYGLTAEVDACVIGGRMWPGYEDYWNTIATRPDEILEPTGAVATPGERAWARLAREIPHYVLSRTMTSTGWDNAELLRSMDELATLKEQTGRTIYLMGGATVVGRAMEAGLVDELRLIVYPLIAGGGSDLFAATDSRHPLELRRVEQLSGGRLSLVYGLGRTADAQARISAPSASRS
jgi:dihydrofolate reductase